MTLAPEAKQTDTRIEDLILSTQIATELREIFMVFRAAGMSEEDIHEALLGRLGVLKASPTYATGKPRALYSDAPL